MSRSVALFFLATLVVFVGSLLFAPTAAPQVTQPFEFNHAAHAEATSCWDCHFICEKNRDEDFDIDCEDCLEADGPFCEEHVKCADHKLPGVPTIATCVRCHEYDLLDLNGKDPSEEWAPNELAQAKLLDFVEIDEYDEITAMHPLDWNRVTQIKTSCVYFNHRTHALTGGIACAECHGDMASLETPPTEPAMNLKMNWCLDCHEEQDVSTDCVSCHR